MKVNQSLIFTQSKYPLNIDKLKISSISLQNIASKIYSKIIFLFINFLSSSDHPPTGPINIAIFLNLYSFLLILEISIPFFSSQNIINLSSSQSFNISFILFTSHIIGRLSELLCSTASIEIF